MAKVQALRWTVKQDEWLCLIGLKNNYRQHTIFSCLTSKLFKDCLGMVSRNGENGSLALAQK